MIIYPLNLIERKKSKKSQLHRLTRSYTDKSIHRLFTFMPNAQYIK